MRKNIIEIIESVDFDEVVRKAGLGGSAESEAIKKTREEWRRQLDQLLKLERELTPTENLELAEEYIELKYKLKEI